MRVLGGVTQDAVGVPLKGSQVVEGWGLLRLLPPLHGLDGDCAALTDNGDGGGILLTADPLPGEGVISPQANSTV